ncbi:MAG: hypothetical protein WC588_04825, partial [Candidatus Micrarchaeia archaeon]
MAEENKKAEIANAPAAPAQASVPPAQQDAASQAPPVQQQPVASTPSQQPAISPAPSQTKEQPVPSSSAIPSDGMDGEMRAYNKELMARLSHAYAIAEEARMKKHDPTIFVEITPAADVAARVEGIVGPKGIATLIRKLEAEGTSRDMVAYMVAQKIAAGEVAEVEPKTKQHLIEQAVRTSVGILTEGVLVAPTEGISKFEIRQNPDGSDYLAIFFAGPIRSAGGTVAALAVVL